MKKLGLVIVLAVVMVLALAPVTMAAGPTNPTDEQLVAYFCSGSGLLNGATALQAYETQWGFNYGLSTPKAWADTYANRMNDFAADHGCGALLKEVSEKQFVTTYFVRSLAPWLRVEYMAIQNYLATQGK